MYIVRNVWKCARGKVPRPQHATLRAYVFLDRGFARWSQRLWLADFDDANDNHSNFASARRLSERLISWDSWPPRRIQ